ncbi:extracellular ribonuclease Bsn [Nonlabens ulvanivorans]|nr:extracellular ribonuclease Bsn [Nonlabens ulvanivorans]
MSTAQVGINTDLPNAASALDIYGQNTVGYGGLSIPIVTELQRAQIITTAQSEGTIVFVSYTSGVRCLEIYDGQQDVWQKINCLNLDPITLYSEDFESYTSGTGINGSGNSGDYPASVSQWTLNDVYSSLASSDYVETQSGVLEINDTNGPIELDTQSINISGYSNISFSIDLSGAGELEYNPSLHSTDDTNTVNDYMDVSYSIDGGAFVTITDFNGNGTTDHTLIPYYISGGAGSAPFFPDDTVTQTGLSGSTLVIRVRFQNWSGDEFFILTI